MALSFLERDAPEISRERERAKGAGFSPGVGGGVEALPVVSSSKSSKALEVFCFLPRVTQWRFRCLPTIRAVEFWFPPS